LLQRFTFAAIAMMFKAAAVARASENRVAIKWQPHGIIEATHLTIEGAMKASLPVNWSGGMSVKA
jgi:hypothetical protein